MAGIHLPAMAISAGRLLATHEDPCHQARMSKAQDIQANPQRAAHYPPLLQT
jgi:hypothetical protein